MLDATGPKCLLRTLGAIAMFAAGLAFVPGAYADIYAFVDADGVFHFSDTRIDARYKLFLREPAVKPRSADAAGPAHNATTGARLKESATRYQAQIADAARGAQVDPQLIHAVITVESGYNPAAVSPKGATGLMQLMPETARRYGATNTFDAGQNLRAGAKYLRDLLEMFSDDLKLALAAYNAGENAVIRHGNRIPPYAETQAYVPRVLARYEALKREETAANCVWRVPGRRVSCRYS